MGKGNNHNGDRIRAAARRIEAALTRNALAQPRGKALKVAQRIVERGAEWERAEIARAEAQAERLRAARENLRGVMAENSPTQLEGCKPQGRAN